MIKFQCAQDQEDFEQEMLIKKWLGGKQNRFDSVDFIRKKHGRKGSARYLGTFNTRSLSSKIGQDGEATLEDFIAGSDRRDLENGDLDYHLAEFTNSIIEETLSALGLRYQEIQWLKKIWLHWEMLNEPHSLTSMIDSEWESL